MAQEVACFLLAAVFFTCNWTYGHADAEHSRFYLDPDECLEAFSAIVKSERVDHKFEYPFLYNVKGEEAELLLKQQSAWLYEEPTEGRSVKKAMDNFGFRTTTVWATMCDIRISDGEPGDCMIGMIRENHSQDSNVEGFLTGLEFVMGSRCDALVDRM
ncbi:hypothetical protein [Roseibium sp. MMSF_3412]|uniref:hypothetical protein n=1 Tax=Roseibium sp. MMSF_3412 TaxID=3046712 RepID=UPI00273EA60C|nr:hypothetical protein [Roseibium sp. MMSF_3412]